MKYALLLLALLLAACGDDDGDTDATPDAMDVPDADLSQCLTERTMDCEVDLAGDVRRMDNEDEFGNATRIRVTTGYDFDPPFPPAQCPVLGDFNTSVDGTFSATVSCDSNVRPPTLLLMIDDPQGQTTDQVARTVMDVALTCPGAGPQCTPLALSVRPPRASVVTSWRESLAMDGVENADVRGLILIRFENGAGLGVDGVAPFVVEGGVERPLVPADEMRFLNSQLNTLTPKTSPTTTGAGWALIAVDGPAPQIGGTKDAMRWEPKTVFVERTWIHVTRIPAPAL